MTITRSRSQVMIVLAWLSGFALALPYVLLCSIPPHSGLQRSLYIAFTIIQTTIGYFFPFIGLCWLYLRMYHAAHRNSERTRKHSISGELLTVMDGSTSVIPQGIDFLTHYMNPFTRAPMAGSVQPVGNGHQDRTSIGQIVPVVVKKTRRRSSNGSSSSLLFREEGRAIKTAFFVLASFFVCWTPHFAFMLVNEISYSRRLGHYFVYDNVTLVEMDSSLPEFITKRESDMDNHQHTSSSTSFTTYGSEWAKFLGVFGMLLSSVLNPFIYVFRNKMACEEISRLLYRLLGGKFLRKEDHLTMSRDKERKSSDNGSGVTNPVLNDASNLYDNDGLPSDVADYQPRYTPCIGKSPKRSSMKSLTPQSSINSTMTNCNSMNGAPADSPTIARANEASHISFSGGRPAKPPFTRSLTLPEQTQPRVKFPPNLIRQKSYAYRPQSTATQGSVPSTDITPAIAKRAKFVRQDSICSIMSNDSVLMICSEDGMSVAEVGPLGILNLALPSQPLSNGAGARAAVATSTISRVPEGDNEEEVCTKSCSIQGTPLAKCYLRQDSNFSDASHRTNDSGVVLSSACSFSKQCDSSGNAFSPDHCRTMRQLSPANSPSNQAQQHQSNLYIRGELYTAVHAHHNGHTNPLHHHPHTTHHRKQPTPGVNQNLQGSSHCPLARHNPMLLQTSI